MSLLSQHLIQAWVSCLYNSLVYWFTRLQFLPTAILLTENQKVFSLGSTFLKRLYITQKSWMAPLSSSQNRHFWSTYSVFHQIFIIPLLGKSWGSRGNPALMEITVFFSWKENEFSFSLVLFSPTYALCLSQMKAPETRVSGHILPVCTPVHFPALSSLSGTRGSLTPSTSSVPYLSPSYSHFLPTSPTF